MSMRYRFRKSDLIGILGLLMLVGWTPAYLAQDPAERPLTDGERIPVAPPRNGLAVVLDVVVQEHGQPARVYGPFGSMRFERLEATDVPGAEYRFVQELFALHFETSLLSYLGDPATKTTYIGADGLAVWEEEDSWFRNTGADARVSGGHRVDGCQRAAWLHHFALHEIQFEVADVGWPWVLDWAIGDHDPVCGDPLPRPASATLVNQAAYHGAIPLFGQHLRRPDRIFDAYADDAQGKPIITCPLDHNESPFKHRLHYENLFNSGAGPFDWQLNERITVRDPILVPCDARLAAESWGWVTPQFPVPVGHHLRVPHAEGGTVFQIDVVPREIHLGAGAPLPLRHAPDLDTEPRAPTPDPLDIPRIPLGALRDDKTPLLHSLSIRAVMDEVEIKSTGYIAEFLQREPHLYGFWAAADGPTSTDNPSLPRVSRWWLFLNDGSQALVLLAEISERIVPGAYTTSIKDLCAAGMDWSPCGNAPLPDLEAEVLEPASALYLAAEVAPPDVHVLQPGPSQTTLLQLQPPLANDGAYVGAVPTSYSWEAGSTKIPGLSSVGRLSANSGHHDEFTVREWTDEAEDGLRFMEARAPERDLAFLDPLSPSVAAGGLLLVLLAALLRLLAALKTGAHLPLFAFLYAKIHKDAVLDHARREAILETVRHDPGVTLHELHKRLGYGWGATVHHVETLRRNGLVGTLTRGRTRHHFPVDGTSAGERLRLAATRDPLSSAFLDAVQAQPGLSLADLAAVLPQGVPGASRTGKRLASLGLVTKKKDGRHVRFFPADTP